MGAEAFAPTGHTPTDISDQPGKSGALRCPHCGCVGRRRTSREITPTHREIYYQCSNLFCGHAWRASESYDWGLTPSAIPNPKVDLPLRVPTRQEVLEMLRPADPAQPELFGPASGLGASPPFEPPG